MSSGSLSDDSSIETLPDEDYIHPKRLKEDKEALYANQQKGYYCTRKFQTDDGTIIPVHEHVLAKSSTYFSELLRTEDRIITLKDIKTATLRCVIDYVYIDEVDFKMDIAINVMKFAHKLKIEDFNKKIGEIISKNLNIHNCVEIYCLAQTYHFQNITAAAYDFLLRHLEDVTDVGMLTRDTLIEFLNDDRLSVRREIMVWDIILQWIEFNLEAREAEIVTLLSFLRLDFIENSIISKKIEYHPYVFRKHEAHITIPLKALFNATRKQTQLYLPVLPVPRIPRQLLLVFSSKFDTTGLLSIYDELHDYWQHSIIDWLKTLELSKNECVAVGRKIYMLAVERDRTNNLDINFECFDLKDRRWTGLAIIKHPRDFSRLVELNGFIYCIGGGVRGRYGLKTVEFYDIERDEWLVSPEMNVPRISPAVTVHGGKIYVVGGSHNGKGLTSMESYDPLTYQWTMLPSMEFERNSPCCVVYNDCIYVMGSFCPVEMFDIKEGCWTTEFNVQNLKRTDCCSLVVNDKIFIVGGLDECFEEPREVEWIRPNVENDTWHVSRNLDIINWTTKACVISLHS